MTMRSTLVATFGALLLGSGVVATAQEPTDAQRAAAVNQAGRLRAITQKSCKEALQVVLDVNADASKAELEKSIALFEKVYAGLTNGSEELGLPKPSVGAAAELAKIAPLLAAYKVEIDNVRAGKADVKKLIDANTPLMNAAIAGVTYLAEETKKATGKEMGPVINLAGRQRMLSQRATKSFFLIAAKHDVDQAKKDLAADVALFEKTQKGLNEGDASVGLPPSPDAEMTAQLDKVAAAFADLKAVLEKGTAGAEIAKQDLAKVAELSVTVFTEANKATQMFELRAAGKN